MKLKGTLILLVLLAGCQDSRVTKLEKRIDHLEQTVHQLEVERNKAADAISARLPKAKKCTAEANAALDKGCLTPDSCTDWLQQADGTYWRECVRDSDGSNYCQVEDAKEQNIRTVLCQ